MGDIDVDPGLQPRLDGLMADHVRALEEAATWEALVVVEREGHLVLVDGFHRLAAAQNLGMTEVVVRVNAPPKDGDLRAQAFSLNARHGRPLSLADRRAEAARLLQAHPEWSDRELGRRAGLAQPTVARVREALESSAQLEHPEVRVGAGGYTYRPSRRPGELPEPRLGEAVGDSLAGVFASPSRSGQRRLVHYLRRLAVALGDAEDLAGWGEPGEVARACQAVLRDQEVVELADVLGDSGRDLVAVATAITDPQATR